MTDSQKTDQIITIDKLEKLHSVFDAYDEDNDGKIDYEKRETLIRAVCYNPTPEEVDDMILDVQKRPFTFCQFLYIVYRHSRAANVEEELVTAFKVFDRNNSGRLPVATVRSILENTRQPFSSDQIDDLLEQADIQNDEVDYTMLVHAILNA